MDGKMKGMIMAGMMALSLILGAMAIFSNEWLTEEEENTIDNTGLSNKVLIFDTEDSDTCVYPLKSLTQLLLRDSKKQRAFQRQNGQNLSRLVLIVNALHLKRIGGSYAQRLSCARLLVKAQSV
jgi:hypothetical protein